MQTISVNTNWCKRCGICAAFCPFSVLELKDYPRIIEGEKCRACHRCEMICPDFSITVEGVPDDE